MKIVSDQLAQNYQLPSIKRGHVTFTSLLGVNGKFIFLDAHIERLLRGAHFLFPNSGWSSQHQELKQSIEKKIEKNENTYLRITIFDDWVHFEQQVLEASFEQVKLTSAYKIKTPDLIASFLKVSNYLESDLELRKANLLGFDDVLFFDHHGFLTEATTSNLFVVTKNKKIKTPPTSSMVLEGVTRQKLFEKLKLEGFDIVEEQISRAELESAREIWLTNSVKGVRFVSQFENQIFEKTNSYYEKAIFLFGRYGELL